MRNAGPVVTVLGALWAVWPSGARADRVHLQGGTELEGKATRQGDKVVVEMEAGQITLSADSVERIDEGESTVQHYQALEAKLRPGDVKGMIALANYCRAHDMRAKEKVLLERVLESDPNQAEARERLGYVKTPAGTWVTREQHMREQGYVQRDGQWVTRERAQELDRMQADAELAERERQQAEAELAARQADLKEHKAELDAERDEAQLQAMQPPAYAGYGYPGVYYNWGGWGGWGGGGRFTHDRPAGAPPPTTQFPINGVRNPRDDTWAIPGTRDPRQQFLLAPAAHGGRRR